MIDNILFQSDNELIMNISIHSTGSSDRVLFYDTLGCVSTINNTSIGSCESILYTYPLMDQQTLVNEKIIVTFS
jgi:hypothetical protein